MPIGLLCLLAIVGLAVAATWTAFDPKEISINGNHRVTRREILARAAIPPHVTIWLQNTGAIERRIEAIPYIARASVHRGLPASIRIAVVERAPFAIVESGDDAAVVDHALRVLEPATGGEALPVFEMEPTANLMPGAYVRARAALELRDAYDAVAAKGLLPTTLALDQFGGLVATMPGGVKLLLGGSNDLDRKLTLAGAILAQIVRGQRRVAAIDLRAPAAPVLVYR
jgi:cell division septal protein FtsQ